MLLLLAVLLSATITFAAPLLERVLVVVDSTTGLDAFRLVFTSARPGFNFSSMRLARVVVATMAATFAGEVVLLGEAALLGETGFRGETGRERHGF